MNKLIVHMIGNAHLDPVWLWNWPSGVDEAMATCKTACDLLDEYPELIITRGEAWVHLQIQKLAPQLFARIVKYAALGRWQIVNGWWIQPDCNFPTAESFRKQSEFGQRYFKENLGVDVTVGYNVDSFGHTAFLPKFLQEAGLDAYVFMRPKENEKHLPANLFIWKSPAHHSVTAFRLSPAYCSNDVRELEANLSQSLKDANRELGHTMCFYGIGDHGGGPTREQIEWIIRHKNYQDDVELRFSHPRAFFDIVKKRMGGSGGIAPLRLPEITGELQYHSIGCYTVVHQIKQEMRRAEFLAIQAERMLKKYPRLTKPDARTQLDNAWQHILFNQFHDILGGSSISSAYEDVRDELGLAKTIARRIIVDAVRKIAAKGRPGNGQQIILRNISSRRFKGYVEFDPYLRGAAIRSPIQLINQTRKEIPCQILIPEAAADALAITRLLIPVNIPAMGETRMQLRAAEPELIKSSMKLHGHQLSNSEMSLGVNNTGLSFIKPKKSAKSLIRSEGIRIASFEDKSDTWSHNISSYEGALKGIFKTARPWQAIEKGPLRMTLANTLYLTGTPVVMQIILQANEPIVRLRLRINWHQHHQIVKLIIPLQFGRQNRIERYDGCPGGYVRRPMAAQEWPMHNFVALTGNDICLAVVSADTFGLDVQSDQTMRITLLRSPYFAHHDPFRLPKYHTYPVTDQGIHEYEIALMCLPDVSVESIMDEVNRQTKPIWLAETSGIIG